MTGDELVLTRGGVVVAGPEALRGARLGQDGRLQSGGEAFRAQSVALPGYTRRFASWPRPTARLQATISERCASV